MLWWRRGDISLTEDLEYNKEADTHSVVEGGGVSRVEILHITSSFAGTSPACCTKLVLAGC